MQAQHRPRPSPLGRKPHQGAGRGDQASERLLQGGGGRAQRSVTCSLPTCHGRARVVVTSLTPWRFSPRRPQLQFCTRLSPGRPLDGSVVALRPGVGVWTLWTPFIMLGNKVNRKGGDCWKELLLPVAAGRKQTEAPGVRAKTVIFP